MLETIKFIQENTNWRALLSQPPFCLSINEDDDYVLLKYSQLDSDFNEQICRECRGLVIDKNTYEPVALSFYKFFNVQEEFADTIDWESAKVLEKIDGSKMMVWYDDYKDIWRISTSSQLDASNAPVADFGITFKDLFDRALLNYTFPNSATLYDCLDKGICYTFELVTPESRVVVPYKKDALYLIGARDTNSFEELDPIALELSKYFKVPKQFKLSNLKDCLNKVEHMGYDEEGFVVVDKYWKRVKIKSPAYVAAHYLKNNGVNSRSRILSIIEKNEQSEFLGLFPEYTDLFNEIETRYKDIKQRMLDGISNIEYLGTQWTTFDNPRKAIANYINTTYKDISGTLFKFIDTDLNKYFVDNEWNKLSKDKKMSLLGYKEVEEKDGNN